MRALFFASILIANSFAFNNDVFRTSRKARILRKGDSRSIDGANWMRNNMHILGQRQLKHICIPGSHNAGMSQLTGGTTFAHKCNVLTQSFSIGSQLEFGVRFLDVRPIISKGNFMTGHYSRLPTGGWQGGNGQSIESIVKEISDFAKTHSELVIVKISHSLNTDLGNKNYRVFNQEEWERFFRILDKTANLFFAEGNVYLPGLTLGQYTDNGKRGAIVYVVEDADLGWRHGRGYFYPGNINVFDKYSNSNKFSSMSTDQIRKMREVSSHTYFLLSWTLTQNAKDVAMCTVKLAKDIKNLAEGANKNLGAIIPEVSTAAYPNIIYVDNIVSPQVTEVCMAVNSKLPF